MHIKIVGAAALVSAGLLFGASACGSGSSGKGANGLTEVQVMEFPGQSYRVPIQIAEEQGYFKDEGIKFKSIPQPNNLQGMQAMQSTHSQVGVLSTATLTQGWQESKYGQAFCGNIDRLQTTLVALPDSTLPSVQDGASPEEALKALSGKKIGVQTPVGSGLQILFAAALEKAGVKNVQYVNIGGGNNITIGALKSHSIDVAQANPPGTQQMVSNKDVKELLYMPDASPIYAETYGSMFVAPTDWLKAHPDAADGFCSAIKKSLDYMRDKSNEKDVLSVIEKETGTTPDVAKEILPTFENYSVDLGTDKLQKTFDLFTQLGINKPEPKLTTDALVYQTGK